MSSFPRWIFVYLLVASSLSAAELRIQVIDETGKAVWARIEVRDPQGRMYQPVFAMRDLDAHGRPGGESWYLGSYVAQGESVVEVPEGTYKIIVERGTEFERVERDVDAKDEQSARVVLSPKPWIRMKDRGWWSADFHVHRKPEDAEKLALAEDLNLSVVFTMWNRKDLWGDAKLPANPVKKIDATHWMTVSNAEDERGGGAWMLHMLRDKLGLAVDGFWYPPGIEFVKKAQAQKYVKTGFPWFDLEKPFWWESPVMVALATPDSMGVLHNHFNQYGVLENEAWGRPRASKKYPDRAGFAAASWDLYYRYLNLGYRIPPSAGSASGVLPNPVGYNRVYVQLDEPFSVEAFYRGLRQGKSFVTNGPMLFFDALQAPGGKTRLSVEAISREPLDRIEIIANGKVIESFAAPENKTEFRTSVDILEGPHSWVAARCYTRNPATIRMAHSHPVYLHGRWNMQEDAVFFQKWIDELSEKVSKEAKSDQERATLLELYGRARDVYEEKGR